MYWAYIVGGWENRDKVPPNAEKTVKSVKAWFIESNIESRGDFKREGSLNLEKRCVCWEKEGVRERIYKK